MLTESTVAGFDSQLAISFLWILAVVFHALAFSRACSKLIFLVFNSSSLDLFPWSALSVNLPSYSPKLTAPKLQCLACFQRRVMNRSAVSPSVNLFWQETCRSYGKFSSSRCWKTWPLLIKPVFIFFVNAEKSFYFKTSPLVSRSDMHKYPA